MDEFTLKGEGFCLKRLSDTATPEMLSEYLNEDDITKYMLDLPSPYTPTDGEAFLKYLRSQEMVTGSLELGILNDNNEFMGVMSFSSLNREHSNAEIGYWIRKKFQGQGIAFQAARLLIEYGFEVLKLKRIYAYVQKENVASINLLEKLGFEREGILKKAGFHRGIYIDRMVYAIISE